MGELNETLMDDARYVFSRLLCLSFRPVYVFFDCRGLHAESVPFPSQRTKIGKKWE